ncbi:MULTISPECIES: alkyl hydroperoxide reductase subunit F [Halopseudomonas]|uniref:Alkyl hydroperoxide reductase subunit F n=1 Tax=Halopseudomonas bauzanensis TaxID=653930 RepID=A0A4U0YP95_9GAMM|nr:MULTISPECIES: alkyl hydroperoxide reductase subunit F [Halopseudomonas]EZQ19297.1 NADH dehydrogenase [Halopseudomonas bauzanensis]TKA90853.1 alkyl hydroperoxide reductase subunit F [Halopseudomonas bauzanensis]WGK60586.1 alkyl hydroperoxide reductase subunit F [Halopseudomonas sp. SMJS2]
MLDANLKKQLDTYLQNIAKPIEISVSVDDSPKGKELHELAVEIAEMSSKIGLVAVDNKRTPSMGVAEAGQSPRVRFAGIPMGHEFTSLVLALLQAGGHPSKADPALLDQIRNLEGEYHFETYISLSCQNCPDVVQALNLMATLNPNISHVMIDGALFQDEVESRQIMAVPTVFLNGEHFGQGRMTLAEIVNKVDSGAAKRKAAELNEKEPYEVLIVGGGPAGAAAAIYAARKGIRTGLVAERFGGQVMDTVGIENFISVPYTEGPKLVASLEQHVKEYDIDVITEQTAAKLTTDDMIEITLESGATLSSRSVILATGARWREMNVPGEQEYRGKGVAYCPHCDGPLFKGKRVAVIGGGNSGIEAAIDLAGIVEHVTVLEFSDTLRADEVLQRKARSLPNVKIIKNAATTEVRGDGNKVVGLTYTDRVSGESADVDVAGIFVQIGLVPNTDWLKDSGINLTRFGEIEIDARGATSLPGVFAAGDVTTVPFKQIVISMGAGATASLAAFDHLIRTSAPEAVAESA